MKKRKKLRKIKKLNKRFISRLRLRSRQLRKKLRKIKKLNKRLISRLRLRSRQLRKKLKKMLFKLSKLKKKTNNQKILQKKDPRSK